MTDSYVSDHLFQSVIGYARDVVRHADADRVGGFARAMLLDACDTRIAFRARVLHAFQRQIDRLYAGQSHTAILQSPLFVSQMRGQTLRLLAGTANQIQQRMEDRDAPILPKSECRESWADNVHGLRNLSRILITVAGIGDETLCHGYQLSPGTAVAMARGHIAAVDTRIAMYRLKLLPRNG